MAVACVAVQMAIALPWIDAHAAGVKPWSASVVEPAIGSVLCGAAFCALGVAIGLLVRNQIVALVVAVGWFTVAEAALATSRPTCRGTCPEGFLRRRTTPQRTCSHSRSQPLLAAYVAGVSVLAVRTTLRRDIA